MLSTYLSFSDIQRWFSTSPYEYLMMFLPVSGEGTDIVEYVRQRQHDINCLTGDRIAYIYFHADHNQPNPIMGVHSWMPPESILCNYVVAEDACKYYHFRRYNLPAILLIPKNGTCELFSIRNLNDLNSYFSPIGIITSYLRDLAEMRSLPAVEQHKEFNKALEAYSSKLYRATFMPDCESYLRRIQDNVCISMELLTIFRWVRDRTLNMNAIIEELNIQIRNENFDTFISCKSQDYEAAYSLYEQLSENGYKPFIADKSLRQLASDNYGYIIRTIISSCSNMIVYVTDINYMTTSYVWCEWNQFLDEQSAGHNRGKIFSIIPDGANAFELPSGLRTKQFFTLNNYREKIIPFLRHAATDISYYKEGKDIAERPQPKIQEKYTAEEVRGVKRNASKVSTTEVPDMNKPISPVKHLNDERVSEKSNFQGQQQGWFVALIQRFLNKLTK